MQRENKWQDRFDEKFDLVLEQDPEIRGIGNEIKSFIQSEIDTARAEERKYIIAELEKCKDDENIWDYIYALKK